MPCSGWIEWNPVTEKYQLILNEFYDVIYCDKCPCPKCLQLDFIKIIVRDYPVAGPPIEERIREIFLTNGVESSITVWSVFALALYEGTLNIKVTAPDPICLQEEWLKIEFSWIFDIPPPLVEVVGAGGGLCSYELPTITEYFGETITRHVGVSACGCNCFDDSPAFSSDHIFGNIVVEPPPEVIPTTGGGDGPEDSFSTAVNFELYFCYSTPCVVEPPVDPSDTLYFVGPDEGGGFEVLNLIFES